MLRYARHRRPTASKAVWPPCEHAAAQESSCEPQCAARYRGWVSKCRAQYLGSPTNLEAFSGCVTDARTYLEECNRDCSLDLMQVNECVDQCDAAHDPSDAVAQCNEDHTAAVQLCRRCENGPDPHKCDGRCVFIADRARDECVSDANAPHAECVENCEIGCVDQCDAAHDPSDAVAQCNEDHAAAVQQCRRECEKGPDPHKCEGLCVSRANRARDECVSDANAPHAECVENCENGCDCTEDHDAAVDDCHETFEANTASGCDGKCHEIEAEVRDVCIADAEECAASCGVGLLQGGCGCTEDHDAAVDDCRRIFHANTASGCDGKCREIEAEVRDECIADAEELLDACEAECGTELLQRDDGNNDTGSVCYLRAETGVCNAAIPRWSYNPSTGVCEQFIYGGCEGNGNNFSTEEKCNTACPGDCSCDPEYLDPVCSIDGFTYTNPCLADCAGARPYASAACPE